MINFKSEIAEILKKEIEDLPLEELLQLIEIPQAEGMGDYALPCFRLAKNLRKAPNLIAEEIKEKISEHNLFMKVEAVSGYVNMFIDRRYYAENVLGDAIKEGLFEKGPDVGKNRRVLVEYSSPNIAKPFHIGHIRSTVIGNSIYKIYAYLGYDALRLNHLGDYGTQFGKMIVAYRRWGNKDDVINAPIETLLSYYVKFHEEADKDPSLEEEARKAFNNLENGHEEETALWQWFRDESLKEFDRVYELLGISFDSLLGESFYSDKMDRVVRELEEKGLLKESEGAKIVDLEFYKLLFALITKSDGSTLYITRDIAAAIYRKEAFEFHKNLYIVGNQQILHFQQWMKIIELMGYDWAKDCVHIPFGLVSLEDGDNLSTRKGKVVFLEDVLNKAIEKTKEIILEKNVNTDNLLETAKVVGIGAVVFNELSNSRAKDYVFSWDKVLNFEGETGPYVQYTYARASSILRKAEPSLLEKVKEFNPSFLVSDSAFRLIRLLYKFDEIVTEAADRYEPSVVARYVVDVAQAFNRYYHEEHILVDDKEEQLSKLALVMVTRSCIKEGLNLLGVTAPEKM